MLRLSKNYTFSLYLINQGLTISKNYATMNDDPSTCMHARRVSPSSPTHIYSSENYRYGRIDSPKYSFHPPSTTRNTAQLNITRVSIWDDGEYSFFCPEDVTKQIHFCLNVTDKPRANLGSVQKFRAYVSVVLELSLIHI